MAAPSSSGNAPSWLFSFVDLAFLLLIAMTQLANPGALDLGELIVPRIAQEQTESMPVAAREGWQLRIHPPSAVRPDGTRAAPYELVRAQVANEGEPVRIDAATLASKLLALRASGADKPALAPHEDSRSHDLLEAVELLERSWPGRRRALVERVVAVR